MKYYTIKDGEVIEVSPLGRGFSTPEIRAKNKTEATQILLRQVQHVLSNLPRLYEKNGAYLLVYPNGKDWSIETGRLDRKDSTGAVNALASGSVSDARHAVNDKTFAYYASDEYVALDKAR